MTPNSSAAIYTHNLPPLLRAATPTTPTQSYSQTLDPDHRSEDKCFSPAPATVQTLVNHIQHTQAASQAGTSSAMQLAATPAATPQAVPLAAIAIPGAASNTGQVSEGMCVCLCQSVCLAACLSPSPPVFLFLFCLSLLLSLWRMCALLSDSLAILAVCLSVCPSVAPLPSCLLHEHVPALNSSESVC